MKNCLNFRMWLIPLMMIALSIGNVTNIGAQSVRVLNSNPDKGGGGITCLWGHFNTASIYLEIDDDQSFNIDLIRVGGLSSQVTNMNIAAVGRSPEGEGNLWKIDLTLLHNLFYYENSLDQVVIEVTVSYGEDDGSDTGPILDKTSVFDVVFCIKTVGFQRENLETKSSILINQISPNPTRDNVIIDLTLPESSEVSMELINGIGQKVKDIIILENINEGNHRRAIAMDDLPKGIYYLIVSLKDEVYTEKIMKL